MEVAPSQMEVAPFQMEVAPFFVDFHHFLSIFTIFCRFSRFTHFCRDLRTFSAISFWPKQPSPHHHTFFACMPIYQMLSLAQLVTQVFLGPSLLKGPVQLFTFCKNCPLRASINDPLPVFYAIALAIFQESKEEECIIKMIQRSFAIMVKMLQRRIIFKG